MNTKDFDLLTESLQQAIEHRRGNRKAARSVVRGIDVPEYGAADVLAVRHKLKPTQHGLANVVGVSPRTVEAWKAGANKPSGAARNLLYLLAKDERVLAMLKA